MTDQYFVLRGSKRFGPYTVVRLRELAAAGRFQPQDTVWKEGMEKPVLAVRVKNLFPPNGPQLAPLDSQPAPITSTVQDQLPKRDTKVIVTPPLPTPLPTPDALVMAPVEVEPSTLAPAPEPEAAPVHKPEPARKRRACAPKGAIILSQDGVMVYYRKKCVQCGHEDASRSTMIINNGISRSHFFCPKCRKSRSVEITGVMQ